MRAVITGGGTGGHVYPALAIARGLADAAPGAAILYIGTSQGLEAQVVPQAGFDFLPITVAGFERRRLWKNFGRLGRLAWGLGQALSILRRFKPDVVVGTGGYVAGPVCLAAAALRIPVVLHEQNVRPGITNRALGRIARTVCLTFAEAAGHFPRRARVRVTGLPVRPQILTADPAAGRAFFGFKPGQAVILSVGGSQGAQSLNEAMLDVIARMAGRPDLALIHVAGRGGFPAMRREALRRGIDLATNGNIRVLPYLYEMEYALAAADLVIGRAGASFLAEVTVRGLPSILVPYPFATANHQELNARYLEREGAAAVILDRELKEPGRLWRAVEGLLSDRQRRRGMSQAAGRLGHPQALAAIVEEVLRAL